MFARITGAAMRAILVAMLITTPALLLPKSVPSPTELIVLLAILASILTFIEYSTDYPSFVEFRDAPPLNRMRFVALFVMVFVLTILCKHKIDPSNLTAMIAGFGTMIGHGTDFSYSPVHLVTHMLPETTTAPAMEAVRVAAGVSYVIGLIMIIMFLFTVRMLGWPTSNGAFNVWVNLPWFDPTMGGDVVYRLQRDSRINVILGVLLPFIIPALIKIASDVIDPITLSNPHTLIWTMSAWAFIPASMVMRGIAMMRVAELIEEKRRRAYANAEAMQAA